LGRGIRSGVGSERGLFRWVGDPERRRCFEIDGDGLCPGIVLNDFFTMSAVDLMGKLVVDYGKVSPMVSVLIPPVWLWDVQGVIGWTKRPPLFPLLAGSNQNTCNGTVTLINTQYTSTESSV